MGMLWIKSSGGLNQCSERATTDCLPAADRDEAFCLAIAAKQPFWVGQRGTMNKAKFNALRSRRDETNRAGNPAAKSWAME